MLGELLWTIFFSSLKHDEVSKFLSNGSIHKQTCSLILCPNLFLLNNTSCSNFNQCEVCNNIRMHCPNITSNDYRLNYNFLESALLITSNQTGIRFQDNLVALDTLIKPLKKTYFRIYFPCDDSIPIDNQKEDKCNARVHKEFDYSIVNVSLFTFDNNLEYLFLSQNCIDKLNGHLVDSFPNLRLLDLSANSISHLSEDFFQKLSKLEKLFLNDNFIQNISPSMLLSVKSLIYLDISENCISNLSPNLLHDLRILEKFYAGFNNLKYLPVNLFQNNLQLRFIFLNNLMLTTIPRAMFANLKNLERIDLSNNNISELESSTFSHLPVFNHLDIYHNHLKTIPNDLLKSSGLQITINAEYNDLQNITLQGTNIHSINLDNNNISSLDFSHLLIQNEDFQISISNNCIQEYRKNIIFDYLKFSSLTCKNCCLTTIFPGIKTKVTKKIDLTDNEIKILNWMDIQELSSVPNVVLNGNPLERINISTDSLTLSSNMTIPAYSPSSTIKLESNALICDCELFNFKLALERRILFPFYPKQHQIIVSFAIEKGICRQPAHLRGKDISLIHPSELICYLKNASQCPSVCECYWQPSSESTIINCSGKMLQKFPQIRTDMFETPLNLYFTNNFITFIPKENVEYWSKIVELHLANNKLASLTNLIILPSLRKLSIINNLIQHPDKLLLSLNNLTTTEIYLSGNPWICSCELDEFKNILLSGNNFRDAHDISCDRDGNSLFLANATHFELCPYQFPLSGKIGIIFSVLFIISIGICLIQFINHKEDIKQWLFVHGLCLKFVTEEDIDSSKKYDAFVSYSSEDDEWVATVLVPGLEKGIPPYTLCLHQRDWLIGEYIPDQIMRSVCESRRTIIVLTDNFINSSWSRLEFSAAYKHMMEDNLNRVLIVVPNELPDIDSMSSELSAFISFNTYIKWKEPHFWRKLRSSMPRVLNWKCNLEHT